MPIASSLTPCVVPPGPADGITLRGSGGKVANLRRALGARSKLTFSSAWKKAQRAQPRYVARVSPSGKQNAYRLPLIVAPAVRHAPFDLALGDFPRRLVIPEDLPTGS